MSPLCAGAAGTLWPVFVLCACARMTPISIPNSGACRCIVIVVVFACSGGCIDDGGPRRRRTRARAYICVLALNAYINRLDGAYETNDDDGGRRDGLKPIAIARLPAS